MMLLPQNDTLTIDREFPDVVAFTNGSRILHSIEAVNARFRHPAPSVTAHVLATTPSNCIGSRAAKAQTYANSICSHWGMENGRHWVLDVCFDEDQCRMRTDHSAENMALLRRLALCVLKKHGGKGSIRGKRLQSGWHDKFLVNILNGK